jgi:hypothetical protein
MSELPIELSGVADAIAEGHGSWRSCSGCHTLNEGHPTGEWSDVLKCHLGMGCFECGGIGAIWDNTDYSRVNDEGNVNPEWAACQTRGMYLKQSLNGRIKQMRNMEKQSRAAFRQPFMAEPANYMADVYREAAALFERALKRIALSPDTPPHHDQEDGR